MNELDLHDALTEIDESFIKEADRVLTSVPVCGETDAEQKPQGRRVHRRIVRIALIAACLVVLLVGTVYAATKGFRGESFLELIGTDGKEEDIRSGYVPIGETKQIGALELTLEDIIGDKNTVYVEISTNYELDAPDGWVWDVPAQINAKGKAILSLLPDEDMPSHMSFSTPFCRDGRLWLFCMISYDDGTDVNLSHLPMQLDIFGKDADGNPINQTFEWTNDYEAKNEVISLNKEMNGILLTDIKFSLTRMDIYFEAERVYGEEERYKTLPLEYIRLDDGRILQYSERNGMPIQFHGGVIKESPSEVKGLHVFNLLYGFSEDGILRLVPFERIQSICVGGEEIQIR